MRTESFNSRNIFVTRSNGDSIMGKCSATGSSAIFTPSSKLNYNETYTVMITPDIKNIEGAGLKSNYQFSFTTEAAPFISIISVIPSDGEEKVKKMVNIVATFSDKIDRSSLNQGVFNLKESDGDNVDGAYSIINGDTVVFDPTLHLRSGETYTLTISPGIKSTSGSTIKSSFSSSFTIQKDDGKGHGLY